jgi:serine/arginine repetitive matrix protein 2
MARSESTGGASVGTNASNSGSIALRAMRSMRSLAHIGSWAQLKNGEGEVKKEKGKKKGGKEGKAQTVRNASQATTSSFEAGALSTCGGSPEASRKMALGGTVSSIPEEGDGSAHKVEKKKSVLGIGIGLGWPSTMRMASSPVVEQAGTVRLVQSEQEQRRPSEPLQVDQNRLSVDSYAAANRVSQASGVSGFFTTRGRSGSRSTVSSQSTAESLRPMSTSSYGSGSGASIGSRPVSAMSAGSGRPASAISSAGSVRWDEERLETLREERRTRPKSKSKSKGGMQSRRASGEGRKRTSLADVFPSMQVREAEESDAEEDERAPPMVTVESATSDGHGGFEDEEDEEGRSDEEDVIRLETPQKRRQRPVSEQLLGKPRPVGMHDDVEGTQSQMDYS